MVLEKAWPMPPWQMAASKRYWSSGKIKSGMLNACGRRKYLSAEVEVAFLFDHLILSNRYGWYTNNY